MVVTSDLAKFFMVVMPACHLLVLKKEALEEGLEAWLHGVPGRGRRRGAHR